jgi:FixJ family two-component response regulator
LSEKISISIVDDDASFREAMVSLMSSHGYAVEAFESAEAFLGSDRRSATDCLIVDFQMPGMSGVELHERLAACGTPVPTILITARQDAATRRRALEAGIVCCLTKPFDEAGLLACIRSAIADDPRPGDRT